MIPEGWKEAAIAWEVCASIHREYAKGKDAFFTTRQRDFVNAKNNARARLAAAPTPQVQQDDPLTRLIRTSEELGAYRQPQQDDEALEVLRLTLEREEFYITRTREAQQIAAAAQARPCSMTRSTGPA